MSSTRFIAVFAGVILPLGWITLSFYCASKQIGMPGGSTEGFIGLFTVATLGKAYSSYTEMKNNSSNNETITTQSNNETITTQSNNDTTISNNTK